MKNWIAALALIAISCGDKVEKPSNLIPEDKMVDILYDLTLLDASRAQNPTRLKQADNLNTYIYKKHGIDSLQFVKSNRFYAADPKEYRKLFEKVGTRIDADLEKAEGKPAKKEGADARKQQLPDEGVVK